MLAAIYLVFAIITFPFRIVWKLFQAMGGIR